MKKMTITPKISFIQEGVNKEINRADISAVLYDDGRYEERKDIVMPTTPIENIAVETTTTSTTSYQQSQQTPQVTESLVVPQYVEKGTSANTFNLLAYGQITNGAYVLDHEFDGITIQWRAIIKNGKQVINTDFQYLGTTPYEATQALNIKGRR